MKKVLSFVGLELLYIVIVFGCMFLGFLNPFCWVYQPVLAAFLAATPVLLICKHWKKFGGVIVLPVIYWVMMLALGEYRGTGRIIAVILVLLGAEILRLILGYNNQSGSRIGYAVVSLMPTCAIFLLWMDRDFYYQGAVEEMGSVAYAEGLMNLATPLGLVALIVCTFVAGYLGALVSEKLFKTKVTL